MVWGVVRGEGKQHCTAKVIGLESNAGMIGMEKGKEGDGSAGGGKRAEGGGGGGGGGGVQEEEVQGKIRY